MGGFNTNVAPPSYMADEIRPPQSSDPLQALATMQQVNQSKQATQLLQQQAQAAQLENQEKQISLQEQQWFQQQAAQQAQQQQQAPANVSPTPANVSPTPTPTPTPTQASGNPPASVVSPVVSPNDTDDPGAPGQTVAPTQSAPILPRGTAQQAIGGTAASGPMTEDYWDNLLDKGVRTGAIRLQTAASVRKMLAGLDETKANTQKAISDAAEANSKVEQTMIDTFGETMLGVKNAGYNPAVLQVGLDHLASLGGPYQQHVAQLQQVLQQNPNALEQIVDSGIHLSGKATQEEREGETAAATLAKTNADTAETTARTPGVQAESDIKVQNAEALRKMTDADWQAEIDANIPDKTSPLYIRTLANVNFYRRQGRLQAADDAIKAAGEQLGRTETAVATAKATTPIRIEQAIQTEAGRQQIEALSPEAVEMGAELFRKTGEMPSFGMSNPMARRQILDRAAQLGPIDVATEQAAFKANEASLRGLQTKNDALESFENTAGRNLDLFLDQAKKAVDTGSPWINSPLRSISKGALGSTDQAAYEAARQVALNEIAKVTNNPNLTGQLTNEARNEVASFNPNSATLAQTYRVAQVLKQDMANRRQANTDQIASIQQRIGRGTGGASTPNTAAPKGKTYTQADLDAAKAAHPNLSGAQIEAGFKAKGWTKTQ
jgi:hypothetical protein